MRFAPLLRSWLPDASGFAVWHLIVKEKALRVRDALVRLYPLTQTERNVDEVRDVAAVYGLSPDDTDKFLETEHAELGFITPLTALRNGRKVEVIRYLALAQRKAPKPVTGPE